MGVRSVFLPVTGWTGVNGGIDVLPRQQQSDQKMVGVFFSAQLDVTTYYATGWSCPQRQQQKLGGPI